MQKGNSSIRKASLTSRKLSKLIAGFAADKKADDIVILDMRKMVNYCDYFVLCSGNTNRLVSAISEHIEDKLQELGIDVNISQGAKQSNWIVADAGDVLVHIFQKDLRDFYKLEYLWRDAKTVSWEEKK